MRGRIWWRTKRDNGMEVRHLADRLADVFRIDPDTPPALIRAPALAAEAAARVPDQRRLPGAGHRRRGGQHLHRLPSPRPHRAMWPNGLPAA
jgi:hypothetical protein